eukprot:1180440-Prorocentrum_minimum.AAC.1
MHNLGAASGGQSGRDKGQEGGQTGGQEHGRPGTQRRRVTGIGPHLQVSAEGGVVEHAPDGQGGERVPHGGRMLRLVAAAGAGHHPRRPARRVLTHAHVCIQPEPCAFAAAFETDR